MSNPIPTEQIPYLNGSTVYPYRPEKRKLTIEHVLSTRVTDLKNIIRAQPMVTINDSIFARQGDFSLIMGQRKAGKTTVSQFIIATALMQRIPTDLDTLGIRSRYCEGKDVVYIDTEGSKEDTADFIKGVLSIMGVEQKPDNFHVYRFREYTQDECKEAVELLFDHHATSHLWLIDGIADLVKSPNQETESNETVRWVIKHAGRLNTCMILVIHENPGTGNVKARGHLGSELERKAGGAIGIVKDTGNKPTRHVIQSRFLRKGADFEDIAFVFDPETKRPITTILTAEERAFVNSKDFVKINELSKLRDKFFDGLESMSAKELKRKIQFHLTSPNPNAKRAAANRQYEAMVNKGVIREQTIDGQTIVFPVKAEGEKLPL